MANRRLGVALALCAAGCADGIPLVEPDLGSVDLAAPPEIDLAPAAPDLAVGDLTLLPCANGVKDGDETGVDCGGASCGPCAIGAGCNHDGDCLSNVCDGTVCEPKLLAFVAATDYYAGELPNGITRLDWNGDGIDDLAVADSDSDPGEIRLLRGLPGGRFVFASKMTVPKNASAIAAGDFNGDKKSDLVVSSASQNVQTTDVITLLLGDGNGGFTASAAAEGPTNTVEFALGDFDGDGHLDVACSGETAAPVLLGDGKGKLVPASDNFSTDSGSIAAGDLDGDGKSDLVLVYGNTANVMLASGKGAFQPPIAYGAAVAAARLGDLDGDGLLDVVAATDVGLQVFFNLGKAQLDAPVDSVTGVAAFGLLLGDWNGDKKLDALVTHPNGSAAISLQSGKGQFGAPTDYPLHIFVDDLVAGDFNQDGKDDFASTDSGARQARVYLAGDDGAMIAASTLPDWGKQSSIAVGDFNGDGTADVVSGTGDHQVSVRAGDGKGGLGAPASYATAVIGGPTAVADLDGDGKADLVVSGSIGNVYEIDSLLNDGKGKLSLVGQVPVNPAPEQVITGDVDGDGRLDLVAVLGNGLAVVHLGQGDGTFQGPIIFVTSCPSPSSIALADWNGDGIADLAVGDSQANQISLLLGTGKAAFAAAQLMPMPLPIHALVAGDFDGDGKADLAAAAADNTPVDTLEILRGKGDGTFLSPTTLPMGYAVFTLALADLDGDKRPELIALSMNGGNVEVFHNLGAPGFAPGLWLAAGRYSTSLGIGDFTSDGKPDLVTSTDTGIALLINASK